MRDEGLDLHVLKPLKGLPIARHADILRMTEDWVKQLPKPCAIFAGQFSRSLIILRACEKAGVAIPEEIALVTNVEQKLRCENTCPPLSTLTGEHDRIAMEMCRTLDNMLKGEMPPDQPVFVAPSGVLERQSSNILAVPHLGVAHAIRLILEKPESVTVSELANSVGLSTRSLDRDFTRHLAMRPGDFIRKTRLKKARELLETTPDTLEAIAKDTGYSSGQSLYLAFKREFGITPGEHRRMH